MRRLLLRHRVDDSLEGAAGGIFFLACAWAGSLATAKPREFLDGLWLLIDLRSVHIVLVIGIALMALFRTSVALRVAPAAASHYGRWASAYVAVQGAALALLISRMPSSPYLSPIMGYSAFAVSLSLGAFLSAYLFRFLPLCAPDGDRRS